MTAERAGAEHHLADNVSEGGHARERGGVLVPPFVDSGELIRVDVETGWYVERARGTPASLRESRGAVMADRAWRTIKAQGGQVVDELRRLLHEGNVRRVVVKQEGRAVAEFPLTVGLVGALVAPVLAAIGALVAVLANCSIEVERARTGAARPRAASAKRKAARPAARRASAKRP